MKKPPLPPAIAAHKHFDESLIIIRMPELETINGIARRLHAWAKHNDVAVPQLLFISEAPTDLSSATNAVRVAEAVKEIADTMGEAPVLKHLNKP